MTRARVIALGQPVAGDDGVGLAVLERLRERGVPAGVELVQAREDLELVTLLDGAPRVVLVDAVLGTPPGEVISPSLEDLARRGVRALSTHGLGTADAVALARTLAPAAPSPAIRVVAVTIEPPARWAIGLSPAVAAAVPRAVERVLALV